MNIHGSNEIVSETDRGKSDGLFLSFLRAAALTSVLAGAVVSVALILRAGRSTPRFLLVLFIIWILSPFVALAWANTAARYWSVLTRAALYCVTLMIMLGSSAFYGDIISPPAGAPRAFVFVVVPVASWLLIAVVIPMAAFISRRGARRQDREG